QGLDTARQGLDAAHDRIKQLEARLAEFESTRPVLASTLPTTATPATFAQVAAATSAPAELRRRPPRTRAAAVMDRLVRGEATLSDFFRAAPRPTEYGATNPSRPPRPDDERLAPLYIRTRLQPNVRGAPIKFCKAALRLLPGMPVILPEVCPIGRENTLWEVFLPKNQHSAFRTAVEQSSGGARMAEDDFDPVAPSKVDFSEDREGKAKRNFILRRGRQIASALSDRVRAALWEFTPTPLRDQVSRAADNARRAMAAVATAGLAPRQRQRQADEEGFTIVGRQGKPATLATTATQLSMQSTPPPQPEPAAPTPIQPVHAQPYPPTPLPPRPAPSAIQNAATVAEALAFSIKYARPPSTDGKPGRGILISQGVSMDRRRSRACGSVSEDLEGRWAFARWSNLILGVVYLEPSAPRAILDAFVQERDRITARFPTAPVIIIGDFNCRMRELGDHQNGPQERRTWLTTHWLDHPNWHRIEPEVGVFTSRGNGGGGVTDLLFGNSTALPHISNFRIHDQTQHISDHAALTFCFNQESLLNTAPFSRLNVRKLSKDKEKFSETLSEHTVELQKELRNIENRVYELAEEGRPLSFEDRTAVANVANSMICDTILLAAEQVAGITHFRGGLAGPQLEEEHVRRIARLREDAIRRVNDNQAAGRDALVARLEVRQFTSALRKAQRRFRARIFQAAADLAVRNPAGEAKRLACI
ncbi:hypothetical protein HK405_010986, partial [Cladochytrium tenue]